MRENRICGEAPIITGSVDTGRFAPNSRATSAAGGYDIAYVSRLVECKGLELFLSIVAELKRRRPTVRAAIAGDGPLRTGLEQLASKLELNGNVLFLGQTDDVPAVLKSARLFMLVSPTEGMSISMLEAMSSALPVVVNDVGDLRDAMADEEAGILLKEQQPSKIADIVLGLLDDSERLSILGAAARRTAVKRYSLEALAASWHDLFESFRTG